MPSAWSSHSKKEVRKALAEAAAAGFEVKPTDSHGHSLGYILCPAANCDAMLWVWSTPTNEDNHAKQIRRFLDRHRHDEA